MKIKRKLFFKRLLFGLFYKIFSSQKREFRYKLVVGAIFKDEAPYLDEWLKFHHAIGVEHFYLYNNDSSDNYQEVLKSWLERKVVTLRDWPSKGAQIAAYTHCIKSHKNEAEWMVFLDLDEFLFSVKNDNLPKILDHYNKHPGVFVYWVLFGSSGHERRPSGSVLEAYTQRLDQATGQTEAHPAGVTGKSKQGKTIFNPRLVMAVDHCCPIMWWGQVVDEKLEIPPRFNPNAKISWDTLRINHYWSKSIEDVHQKVLRGQAKSGKSRELQNFLNREKELNKETDLTVLPLWTRIKKI